MRRKRLTERESERALLRERERESARASERESIWTDAGGMIFSMSKKKSKGGWGFILVYC